jgi:hypothetical protein
MQSSQPTDLNEATASRRPITCVGRTAEILVLLLVGLAFSPIGVPASSASCPNDVFRSGRPSAQLPDCRAYEQATPIDKNGGNASGHLFNVQASISGDGITSLTKGGLPGGEGAQAYPLYLSQRGAASWSTRGVLPPPSYGEIAFVQGWTPDLEDFALVSAVADSDGTETDRALLIRAAATNAISQITPYLDGADYALAGASRDGSKLFFEIAAAGLDSIGGAAVEKDNLYVYEPASQGLSLVGVLPNGAAPPDGSFAGPLDWNGTLGGRLAAGGALGPPNGSQPGVQGYLTQELHAISADGSNAFFTTGMTGQLYMREGIGAPAPATVRISAEQRTAPDPAGAKPAIFMGATPSGSVVFFTSCQKLTDDATAHSTSEPDCQFSGQGQDLYAFDTGSSELHDLTVDAADPLGADVQGMIGASDDGSYVYFVANGDLDGPTGPGHAGDCEHQTGGAFAYTGTCSLYVWHAGEVTFVAQLEPLGGASWNDAADWLAGGAEYLPTGRVSADGQAVVFRSHLSPTGYDNEPGGGSCFAVDHAACPEFFRYHFGDVGPSCLTCDPTGLPPALGGPTLQSIDSGTAVVAHPTGTRFASASGNQVFFETPEQLVGADVNGDHGCPLILRPNRPTLSCQDVYEWEAMGSGSCTEASPAFSVPNGGCLFLLSTGTSPDPSFFGDASASGEHAFIFTSDQLVPSDEDQLYDLYDVAVGGGLSLQNQGEEQPPTGCEVEACGGAVPGDLEAGSAAFRGPPDPKPEHCSKGRVAMGFRCVKRHRKKHRRSTEKPKKQAGSGRGARR